jgi:hypothetical protein
MLLRGILVHRGDLLRRYGVRVYLSELLCLRIALSSEALDELPRDVGQLALIEIGVRIMRILLSCIHLTAPLDLFFALVVFKLVAKLTRTMARDGRLHASSTARWFGK